MSDEKGWGKGRHRRSCSSVNDCTTSGLAHIGRGRMEGGGVGRSWKGRLREASVGISHC